MFNLGSKQSYIGLIMGFVFLGVGGVFLLQELGFLFLIDYSVPLLWYAFTLVIAGLVGFASARSVYVYALSYALMLMGVSVLVFVLGIVSVLTELKYISFSFVPASSLMYESLLVVIGAFILGTSFKH